MNSFMGKFMKSVDEHAPLRKRSVKCGSALWLDDELRSLMLQRDKVKAAAHKSGCFLDGSLYCKLRNKVTKFNYIKEKEYFNKICECQ